MQTFLPYPSFAESMAVLDGPRLGKQRVETLQLLRASLIPSYGWQSHPVTLMWRGFLPGLAAYGLASVDAWTASGRADSTRALIAEFAPEVDGMPQEELSDRGLLPAWIGDEALHRSHRSNLVRKDPAHYRPFFPDVPDDLEYLWPAPGEPAPPRPEGERLWVLRAPDEETLEQWLDEETVSLGERSPRGALSPKWRAQVAEFVDALEPGAPLALLVGNGRTLHRATVSGGLETRRTGAGETLLVRRVEVGGELGRDDFAVPAILQDPRSLFAAPLRPGVPAIG